MKTLRNRNESGQATMEMIIVSVALGLFLLMLLGVFTDMHLKLVANYQGYELAFCSAFRTDVECKNESRDALEKLFPKNSNLQLETTGSIQGRKGEVKFKGVIKNEMQSQSYFLLPLF